MTISLFSSALISLEDKWNHMLAAAVGENTEQEEEWKERRERFRTMRSNASEPDTRTSINIINKNKLILYNMSSVQECTLWRFHFFNLLLTAGYWETIASI